MNSHDDDDRYDLDESNMFQTSLNSSYFQPNQPASNLNNDN